MDQRFNARYPFSKSARKRAESLEIKLDFDSIERGRKRAEDAVIRKRLPTYAGGDSGADDELVSYAIARMIVSQTSGRQAIEAYSVSEAKRASAHMKSDSEESLFALASEFGLSASFEVPVLKYVKYAPGAPEYKLVNRKVEGGRVKLTKNEFVRVLEEAVRLQISASLPLKMAQVPPGIKLAAEGLLALMPKAEVNIVLGERPPCIEKLVERLMRGENLPHSARWTLAIYLIKAGMKDSEIVKVFSTAPDFNEKTTQYQVEHLRKRGYSMPSCKLIDSHGHCVYRCGVGSPIYYRGKNRGTIRAL